MVAKVESAEKRIAAAVVVAVVERIAQHSAQSTDADAFTATARGGKYKY